MKRFFTSKKNQSAKTPLPVLRYIKSRFGKFTDQAPPNYKVDSLSKKKWSAFNYVNPPFRHMDKWIEKAVEQHQTHNCKTLLLVPFRPYRKYFQKNIHNFSFVEYLPHSITFRGYTKAIPHVMCFIGIGLRPSRKYLKIKNFFILNTETRLSFDDLPRKINKDFRITSKINMYRSNRNVTHKNFFVPLYDTMKTIHPYFNKSAFIIVPRVLKGVITGSVGVIQSRRKNPPTKEYQRVKLYVNDEVF